MLEGYRHPLAKQAAVVSGAPVLRHLLHLSVRSGFLTPGQVDGRRDPHLSVSLYSLTFAL